MLVDSTGQYFGIVAQKKNCFVDQTMLQSTRTQELKRTTAAIERKKIQMSRQFVDEEAEAEYCKRMLKQYEEKNARIKQKELEKRKSFQKMILVDQVYEDVDIDEDDHEEDHDDPHEDTHGILDEDVDDFEGPSALVDDEEY